MPTKRVADGAGMDQRAVPDGDIATDGRMAAAVDVDTVLS